MGSWHEDPRIFRMIVATLLCVALFALLWGLQVLAQPIIGPHRYAIDGGPWIEGAMPLSFPSTGKVIAIELPLFLSSVTPRSLQIRPDDCLEAMTINGNTVTSEILPFCDYINGRVIDLRTYLHTGENILTLIVRDDGGRGGLDIRPPHTNPLLLALTLGWMSVLAFFLWILLRFFLPKNFHPLAAVFIAGTFLRLFYLLHTPYTLRGHDADGHLEYVQYLLTHLWLPPTHGGWEFYQPPLYYVLGALEVAAANLLGIAVRPDILLQIFGFLCTTAALGIGILMGTRLFEKKNDRILFGVLLATLPSSLFSAARINNDVLLLLLGTLSIALLLRWWEHPSLRSWFLSIGTVALGLLTKFNAALLLPLAFLLLFFQRGHWVRKCGKLGASLLLLLLFTGWFYLPRTFLKESPQVLVVGNIGNLNSGLRVPTTFSTLFTLNPLQILAHPFNNAWDDAERRQYFWEYFFRSAFFGEFSYAPSLRPLAIAILTLALLFVPLTVFGIWSSLRSRAPGATPLFHLLWTGLLGSLAYRLAYPFASSQDFRYSILLVIPVTFFLVTGIAALPKIHRHTASLTALMFAGLCAAFIIAISILP